MCGPRAHAGVRGEARAEVARYGVDLHAGRAVSLSRVGESVRVGLDGGATVLVRRLVVTTGLLDELPQVPGLAERWGRDVIHCPYCHGWEVRDRTIGVLTTSAFALHQVGLFRVWLPGHELLGSAVYAERITPRPARRPGGVADAFPYCRRHPGDMLAEPSSPGPRSVQRAATVTEGGLHGEPTDPHGR